MFFLVLELLNDSLIVPALDLEHLEAEKDVLDVDFYSFCCYIPIVRNLQIQLP